MKNRGIHPFIMGIWWISTIFLYMMLLIEIVRIKHA